MRASISILLTILCLSSIASGQERFLKDSNGIITDTQTGLLWCIGPEEPYPSWYGANDWVNGLAYGWELPSILQLQDLYDAGINTDNWGLFENKGFTGTWVWSNDHVPNSEFAWNFTFFNDLERVEDRATRQHAEFANAFRYGRAFAVMAQIDRFISDGEIITDTQTSLEWRISPNGFCEESEIQEWVKGFGEGWRLPTITELETLYIAGITSSSMAPFDGCRQDLLLDSFVLVWCKGPYGFVSVFDFHNGEEWIPGTMGYRALSVTAIAVRVP